MAFEQSKRKHHSPCCHQDPEGHIHNVLLHEQWTQKPSSTGARDGQNTQTALDVDLNDAREGMANGTADMEVEPARAETLSTVMTRASVWLRARRSIVVWRVQRGKAQQRTDEASRDITTTMGRVERTITSVHTPMLPLVPDDAGGTQRLDVTQMPLLNSYPTVAPHVLTVAAEVQHADLSRSVTMSEQDFTLSIRGDAATQGEVAARLLVSMLTQECRVRENRIAACDHFADQATDSQ